MKSLNKIEAHLSDNNLQACPVCESKNATSLHEVFDDRYGQPDLFHLVRCDDCGHIMTAPMLREDELSHLYGTYYPRKKTSAHNVTLEAKKIHLPFSRIRRWWMGTDNQGQYNALHGEKMLDIGSGSGLSLLEARELGIDAWGIEADQNVKIIADELNLKVYIGSLNDNPFKDATFDLVILNQVIEHIPEPDKALKIIRTRLTKGGRVILVFPNINSLWCKLSGLRWINWHIPYHLHHFNKKTFTQMAERLDYKIVRTRTITPNVWSILQLRAMSQSIARGQPNSAWSVKDKSLNSLQQSSSNGVRDSLRGLILIPVMLVLSILNRIVDVFGFGDSLLVELKPKDSQ